MLSQIVWRATRAGTFDVFEDKRVGAIYPKIVGLQIEAMLNKNNKEKNTPKLVIYQLILTWEALAIN